MEEKIFQKYFIDYLPRPKFKEFIRKADLRFFGENSQICNMGNSFTSLYYVGLIHEDFEVKLYKEDTDLHHLEEDYWVGITEFVKYIKLKVDKEKAEKKEENLHKNEVKRKEVRGSGSINVKWGISSNIRKKEFNDDKIISKEREELYLDYPEPCYIYIFDIKDLEELFDDGEHGTLFRNSIYSIWLHYTSKVVIRLDNLIGSMMKNNNNIQVVDNVDFTKDNFGLTAKE